MSCDAATQFWDCVRTPEMPELGQGPRTGVKRRQELEAILGPVLTRLGPDAEARERLMATALLYHDQHDAAHDRVQDMADRDGALIHAILHRREPDFWNARYWFRRADDHPVYHALAPRVVALGESNAGRLWVRRLTLPGILDPFAFVDACELLAKRPQQDPEVTWMRQVQHAEFDCLVRHLLGSSPASAARP